MYEKNLIIAIVVVIAVVVVSIFFVNWAALFGAPQAVPQTGTLSQNTDLPQGADKSLGGNAQVSDATSSSPASAPITTKSGLQYQDEVIGTGATAIVGQKISVHYVGLLTNGTKFDSSVDRGTPFSFTLGAGQVIKGWDEGVVGMKVGGKRILVIPPTLGYGAQAVGPIPANSVLLFEVQLLSVGK